MILISIIIPTYNRYERLLKAIESVKNQIIDSKYKTEIIVVNDCSTDERYKTFKNPTQVEHSIIENLKFITLDQNSKQIFGYACAGYVRNIGLKHSTGDLIAFLDDDDYWLPHKLQTQINKINKQYPINCTEGLIGHGSYNKDIKYKLYNKEHYQHDLNNITGYTELPEAFDSKLLSIHNVVICSSVLFTRDVFNRVGYMKHLPNGQEDYEYWTRIVNSNINIKYINKECIYYDLSHGKQN